MDYNNDTYGGSLTAKITFVVISIEGKLGLEYSDAKSNTIEDSTVEVFIVIFVTSLVQSPHFET